jgi:hypothetical protein
MAHKSLAKKSALSSIASDIIKIYQIVLGRLPTIEELSHGMSEYNEKRGLIRVAEICLESKETTESQKDRDLTSTILEFCENALGRRGSPKAEEMLSALDLSQSGSLAEVVVEISAHPFVVAAGQHWAEVVSRAYDAQNGRSSGRTWPESGLKESPDDIATASSFAADMDGPEQRSDRTKRADEQAATERPPHGSVPNVGFEPSSTSQGVDVRPDVVLQRSPADQDVQPAPPQDLGQEVQSPAPTGQDEETVPQPAPTLDPEAHVALEAEDERRQPSPLPAPEAPSHLSQAPAPADQRDQTAPQPAPTLDPEAHVALEAEDEPRQPSPQIPPPEAPPPELQPPGPADRDDGTESQLHPTIDEDPIRSDPPDGISPPMPPPVEFDSGSALPTETAVPVADASIPVAADGPANLAPAGEHTAADEQGESNRPADESAAAAAVTSGGAGVLAEQETSGPPSAPPLNTQPTLDKPAPAQPAIRWNSAPEAQEIVAAPGEIIGLRPAPVVVRAVFSPAETEGADDAKTFPVHGYGDYILRVQGVEHLTLEVEAGASLVLAAPQAKTVTIKGAGLFSLSFEGGAAPDQLERIDASGFKGDFTFEAKEVRPLHVIGGTGDDKITLTGDQDNKIETGSGNDVIQTGDGADEIHAADGADVVNAGAGDNAIFLGTGPDRVTIPTDKASTLSVGNGNMTQIFGFSPAEGDKIAFTFAGGGVATPEKQAVIQTAVDPLPSHASLYRGHKAAMHSAGVEDGEISAFAQNGNTYAFVRNENNTLVELRDVVNLPSTSLLGGALVDHIDPLS